MASLQRVDSSPAGLAARDSPTSGSPTRRQRRRRPHESQSCDVPHACRFEPVSHRGSRWGYRSPVIVWCLEQSLIPFGMSPWIQQLATPFAEVSDSNRLATVVPSSLRGCGSAPDHAVEDHLQGSRPRSAPPPGTRSRTPRTWCTGTRRGGTTPNGVTAVVGAFPAPVRHHRRATTWADRCRCRPEAPHPGARRSAAPAHQLPDWEAGGHPQRPPVVGIGELGCALPKIHAPKNLEALPRDTLKTHVRRPICYLLHALHRLQHGRAKTSRTVNTDCEYPRGRTAPLLGCCR